MYIWAVSWENLLFAYAKNKDAEQLHGNHTADQHLCIHYIVYYIYFLNPKF